MQPRLLYYHGILYHTGVRGVSGLQFNAVRLAEWWAGNFLETSRKLPGILVTSYVRGNRGSQLRKKQTNESGAAFSGPF